MSNVIERSATAATVTSAAPPARRTNTAANAPQVEKRVVYLLGLVVAVMFGYPVTQVDPFGEYVYLFLYALMVVTGGSIAGNSRVNQMVTTGSGLIYVATALFFAGTVANDNWAQLPGYAMLMVFQILLLRVLARYLFGARSVTLITITAAATIYLLLGALFVPLYGLIDWFLPGSFVDGAAAGTAITWHQLIYYSYVTLTSTGYGDILPVSLWARSAATLEAILGILYITVIMSRLVGIYSTDRRSESDLNL
jgi:hypothetical protein